jgi:hypothetical protein
MSLRLAFRFVAFLVPLPVFALVLTSPYYSARLSLILHGRPFARVVSKEKLDIFKFVSPDGFACRAIVFSNDKAVGWICLPSTAGFASFVPFSDNPNLEGGAAFDPWFDFPLMIAWLLRWWLLPAQVVILPLWLRKRAKRVPYSGP